MASVKPGEACLLSVIRTAAEAAAERPCVPRTPSCMSRRESEETLRATHAWLEDDIQITANIPSLSNEQHGWNSCCRQLAHTLKTFQWWQGLRASDLDQLQRRQKVSAVTVCSCRHLRAALSAPNSRAFFLLHSHFAGGRVVECHLRRPRLGVRRGIWRRLHRHLRRL